jgi:hypothetical protein
MRYVLAAIFVWAVGTTAASALPTLSARAVSLSMANPIVQVVKRTPTPARRHARNLGGIHPLVGSGGY